MSLPHEPPPAKLILGLLFRNFTVRDTALGRLFQHFGPPDGLTAPQPFGYTTYYDLEMGQGLLRQVCSLHHLVPPDRLPEIKLATNRLEAELSHEGKRLINIDPGMLSEERLILATGKNYTHRVYLRNGIYADLTLVYQKGGYRSLPWTYPDYQEPNLLHFLGVLRQKLQIQRHGRFPAKYSLPP